MKSRIMLRGISCGNSIARNALHQGPLDTLRPSLVSRKSRLWRASKAHQTTAAGAWASSFHSSSTARTAAIALLSLSVGVALGRQSMEDSSSFDERNKPVLPNGLPRTCCDESDESAWTDAQQKSLITKLQKVVGVENVLDSRLETQQTLGFTKGARLGHGPAVCIVTPRTLHDVVTCIEIVTDAACVVLPQGQNTGLTGGSVPRPHSDRPVVIVSMKYLNRIFPIDDGKRLVCLAGAGLADVQRFLQKHFPSRESHSVLGSTFLNPTAAAGVALGSGGTQCRKGPAYTERALYVQVVTNKWKEPIVKVINTLDVEGMEEKEFLPGRARKNMDSIAYKVDTWSRWIQDGYERTMKYTKKGSSKNASDVAYGTRLCELDGAVSRYNADTTGPDHVRSEGKVVLLATVHDTFPKPASTRTVWLSFDSLETALEFRKTVCLDNAADLPVSAEYMDRDAFDVVDRSGRVLANTIKLTGTASSLVAQLWRIKLWVEALPIQGADRWVDKFLHLANPVMPAILPSNIQQLGKKMDHHVAMTVGDYGDGSMERIWERLEQFTAQHGPDKVQLVECKTTSQAQALTAFRFVAAPAFRTWCVGENKQGFSVDYALPKNGGSVPPLEESSKQSTALPVKRMRYSHFACNVVHEDLAYGPDVDIDEAKHTLKHVVEHSCGGKLPAEHGHGTEYVAPPETRERWKRLDPMNVLNPGVGGLSDKPSYQE